MNRGSRRYLAMTRSIIPLMLLSCLFFSCNAGAAGETKGWLAGAKGWLRERGIGLGGYTSLKLRDLRGAPWRLEVSDLSLFVGWEPTPRWRLFSELELGDALVWRPGSLGTRDTEFDLERLYAEYEVLPGVHLRAGKFLTPVGRWNRIHADPLVWTVTRPLTTGVLFARHAVGLDLEGSTDLAEGVLEFSLYGDDSRALEPDRSELALESGNTLIPNTFQNAVGLRLHYRLAGGGLGFSLADFSIRGRSERKRLYGIDLQFIRDRFELTAEALYRHSHGPVESDEYGGFLQGVIGLGHHLHLITRYEYFRLASPAARSRLGLAGLAWRFARHQVLKLEYRQGADNEATQPDGWLAGYAVLF